MNFVKQAVNAVKDNKSEGSAAPTQGGAVPTEGGAPVEGGQAPQQKDDYVDKAFAFASSKSGKTLDRNTQEKITDGGRQAYEKLTGSKVSDKVSN